MNGFLKQFFLSAAGNTLTGFAFLVLLALYKLARRCFVGSGSDEQCPAPDDFEEKVPHP